MNTSMREPLSEVMPEVSVVIPCLNEAETLAICIRKAQSALQTEAIVGEVLVADNGSTDGSREIARAEGARVIEVPARGYGSALIAGIGAARGRFVIMGDADDSYDFLSLGAFVRKLRDGFDLVMGNRFLGGIEPGAMPFLHRYLGNPVLSTLGRLFFGSPCGDFHCGMRGFDRRKVLDLGLQSTGMEFASAMIVQATLNGFRITEVPTSLKKDGRSRPPHLRTWRDGWRHLRFILLYSPRWLFLYPGIALLALSLALSVRLAIGPLPLGHVTFDIHTLFFATSGVLLSYQLIGFAFFSKSYAVSVGLLPPDPKLARIIRHFSLEIGLGVGLLLGLAGVSFSALALLQWSHSDFGGADPTKLMRIVIPAGSMACLGLQTIFMSFLLHLFTAPDQARPLAAAVSSR